VQEAETIQGRRIGGVEIDEIRGLIEQNPGWSRRRLSEVLAERWHWYAASGQLKDMAARTLLGKLDDRGLIVLPPRRRAPATRRSDPGPDLFECVPPAPVVASLSSLRPLQIQVIGPKDAEYRRFRSYLRQHHYLGHRGPVGENLGYLIRSRAGVDLACLLFGAAAWQCAGRDRWIGWSAEQRMQGLPFIANNSRFLILPSVVVPHLASHVLSLAARRLPTDWLAAYRVEPLLLETLVDRPYTGTCYRAANWICVGQTQGRGRMDRTHEAQGTSKDILLYPLGSHWRQRLCQSPAPQLCHALTGEIP